MGTKWDQEPQKWEQERNKVGTKWDQEPKKWEQERNKVGSRTHKWEQERMSQSVLHTTSIHVRKAAVVRGSIAAQFQAAISSTLNRTTNENGILPKMYH